MNGIAEFVIITIVNGIFGTGTLKIMYTNPKKIFKKRGKLPLY